MNIMQSNLPLRVESRTEIDGRTVSFVRILTSVDEIPYVYRMLREYAINIGLPNFEVIISSDSVSLEF